MSHNSKDHGQSHSHGTTESEQSAANKKKNSESSIFGYNNDNNDSGHVKQTRHAGNNIFGAEPEKTAPKTTVQPDKTKSSVDEAQNKPENLAQQYKQTQMKSNIFGTDEPAPTRHVSDKNKSNIFGHDEPASTRQVADKNKSNVFGQDEPATTRQVSDKNKSNIFGIGDNDEQNKRQPGGRQGLRVGYNPISGESYSTKESVNSKNENTKQSDSTVKTLEEQNGNAQVTSTHPVENDNIQKPVEKSDNGHDNTANGNNAQKNVHTSVRVFHPPGGKSNGPLW